MTYADVKIQIAPEAVPSIPSWFGEVAVMAQVFAQFGLLKAIQQDVRFARARFGRYEIIDFVAVILGYALCGEPTLEAFYLRLAPFALPFMALFGRARLPHRATLSRFLAALDQPPVEALRTLFQKDLVARPASSSPPGGLWDRQGQHWLVMDVDGTRQAARQRALPQTPDLPAPIAVWSKSAPLDTWGASAEKWCGLGPPSCKRTRISGWVPMAARAMAITEEN